jgi:hypothetical protein
MSNREIGYFAVKQEMEVDSGDESSAFDDPRDMSPTDYGDEFSNRRD